MSVPDCWRRRRRPPPPPLSPPLSPGAATPPHPPPHPAAAPPALVAPVAYSAGPRPLFPSLWVAVAGTEGEEASAVVVAEALA
jgi:hypothetical protein